MTNYIVALLLFSLGLIVGIFIKTGQIKSTVSRTLERNVSGKLKIDSSDPDGPYLFLELKEDVDDIQQRKYAILEVDMSGYVSQK